MKLLLSFIFVLLSYHLDAQIDIREDYVIVSDIILEGNKSTKSSVIYRELTFSVGDTIPQEKWENELRISNENLKNTTLFNFVTFDQIKDDTKENSVVLIIKMTERWYVWLYPYIAYADRNINAWYEAKNISRFSLGAELEYKNFLGLKHNLSLTIIGGYNQNYGFLYDIPYITDKQRFGLKMSFAYKRNKEMAYNTVGNKVIYFKSYNEFADQSIYASLTPYYRHSFRNKFFLEFKYNDRNFNDSLSYLNEDFANTEGTRFQYFSLSATFKNDFRDDQNYPLNGHYFELLFEKVGLGFFSTSPDFFYGKMTIDWYQPIRGRWYWSSNITTRLSDDKDPLYFLNQGLGYNNDFVRTYELYVIDAVNYALMKNNLKFAILNPVTKYLPFVKNERFGKIHLALYVNLFFDCAYTWNMTPNISSLLDNKFIFGTGIGIDFVTYYDKVIRFEYGINDMGETGLFIHFVAPI